MGFFAPEIGIDLGTSNTLVYVRDHGVVINEPTVVVTDSKNRRNIRAVGEEATYLLGRTTANLSEIRPMKNGTVADFDTTEALLRYFIRKAIGTSYMFRPRLILAVPCSLPVVARKAVEEAARIAGAHKDRISLIAKPYAAAIGSGLPVYDPVGSMVVDVGGGTTDVAITSLGGMVVAKSIPVGGMRMDEAIMDYLYQRNMQISPQTAERVRHDLGSAVPIANNYRIRIIGRDTVLHNTKDMEFTAQACYEALQEPCRAILSAIKWVLERTPPELASDIMKNGIHLTGGASQLIGLDHLIAEELGIPVLAASKPMDSTINGIGTLVENIGIISTGGGQVQSE